MDPVQMLLYACIASILILSIVQTVRGKMGLLFSYTRREYFQSLGFGFLNPFLYYIVLFKAYDLLPAQEAQPLNYTWALTLAFLSIPLLKQKLSRNDIIAAFVCYSGVWVISTRGNIFSVQFSDLFGVILALGSTVIWALYWIFNTKDSRDPVAGILLNFIFGLPFVFVYCLIFSDIRVNSPEALLGAAYVGFFEMGITFILWLSALKLSSNTAKIGNLIFISPFISLILIHFLVGEEIYTSTFAGLILIIIGLIIQRFK